MLSEELRWRIEESIRTWNDPDSEARKRFEEEKKRLDAQHRHITEAIEASERNIDRSVRINTLA